MTISIPLHALLLSTSLLIFTACDNVVPNETTTSPNETTTSPNETTTSPNETTTSPNAIHINELLASNLNTNMDRDFYQFSDWIELFNNSDQAIDISGYHLSDDADKPTMWQFPQGTTLAAHGYLLVWADKEDTKAHELHTNFSLSSKQESLLFSDKEGNLIDHIQFSQQVADISCITSKENTVYMTPTPLAENRPALSGNSRSTAPQFSNKNSFIEAATISISADNDAKIYYTTDGSTPTKESTLYTKAITISKTTLLQSVAIEEGRFPSTVANHTYFIGVESTLPVVSLATDPKYLYDDIVGIYTEGTNGIPLPGCGHDNTTPHNFAQDWDRPVHLTYFDENNHELFSIGTDFAISGQCSRYNKKKSFKFNLDSKYGTKSIKHKLYPTKNTDKIKDFKLRAGNFGFEFGDILASLLVESGNLNVDYQAYSAVRMFMNGDYWGVYNIREKKGGDFITSNYPDVDKKELDVIKNSNLVKEGSIDEYKLLQKARTYQDIIDQIDEDNFIDYMALMIYSGNEDWSYSNSRAWKEQKPGAQWRWMLDDVDEGLNEYVLNINNLNGPDGATSEHHELSTIFNILMSNTEFKTRFKDRFNELLNSTFSPANVNVLIDKIVNERVAYMPLEPLTQHNNDYWAYDYATYQQRVRKFADERSAIVKTQLNGF